METCVNCTNPATHKYIITIFQGQLYCALHIPKFLKGSDLLVPYVVEKAVEEVVVAPPVKKTTKKKAVVEEPVVVEEEPDEEVTPTEE
jgi:hypothetical protein